MYKAKVFFDVNAIPQVQVFTSTPVYNVQVNVSGNAVTFSHPNIGDNTVCLATLVEKYGGDSTPVFSTGNGIASVSVYNTVEQENDRFSANILIDL